MNHTLQPVIMMVALAAALSAPASVQASVRFKSLHTFEASGDGAGPQFAPVQASDGNFYGVTTYGGQTRTPWSNAQTGYGAVYRLTASGEETTIYSFSQADGSPTSALLQGADGRLYGTAASGTEIYAINTDGSGFTILYPASGATSAYILLGFQGPDGRLYGETAPQTSDSGTVFAINTDGTGFDVLHQFVKTDGRDPTSILLGADGRIYGTTANGGVTKYGVVFGMNLDGSGFADIHSFTGGFAQRYPATLVQAASGRLCGTTYGTVFSLTTSGSGFKTLADVSGTIRAPEIIVGSDDRLYGIAALGTQEQQVFRLDITGKQYTVLLTFDGVTLFGLLGVQGLMQASSGRLYGVGQDGGGPYDGGGVFSCATSGKDFKLAHGFAEDVTSPQAPIGGVIEGSDGSFYGVTAYGDKSDGGCIFKIADTGRVSVLHEFSGADGKNPFAPLLQGADGRLYGTTEGGPQGPTVFAIDTDGTGFVSLGTIPQGGESDTGGSPVTALIQGSDGRLYGTSCLQEDAFPNGSVFSAGTDGSGVEKICDFSSLGDSNGIGPATAVTQGTDGGLYGVGTYIVGTSPFLYSLATDGSGFTTLYSFSTTTTLPSSQLVQMGDGTFYATTIYGGAYGYGDVFAIRPDGTGFTEVHSFDGTNGSFPCGPVAVSADGTLYGVTATTAGDGISMIYSLSTKTRVFKILWTFNTAASATLLFPNQEGVTLATNGSLFGAAFSGGTPPTNGNAPAGYVYRVTP